ncbi:hypothetical protein E4Q08_23035 [Candidatus Accumulibacter phosphatis]|nr:hypothetical protein [Candidatus Accumulibacter contiguus]NMQ07902.1 hypothetical protein [Candidatus Accumulibacter contiguus]
MLAFFERFGDLAFEEMRVLTVPPGNPVPADEYGFLEFYCTDDDCDCRRVIIKVVGRKSADKVWATISYGWEQAAFYRKWSRGTENAHEWQRPTLDPLNPQSSHARDFLAAFEQMIQDKTYVDRLKRHYEMFKKSPQQPGREGRKR